jgi:hypothetical protein
MHPDLTHLRAALGELHTQLIEAEAELADRLAEINAFEFEFEARVGHLIDTLETLEADIQAYNDRIQMARNKAVFGYEHLPVDRQYQRTWHAPPAAAPTPPPQPLDARSEAEIKRLYRQLARRFHPDLAADEADRAWRTEKMSAINDAYAARSLVELIALSEAAEPLIDTGRKRSDQTDAQMMEALKAEIARCRHRLREIEKELHGLRYRPSVEVSIEVKMARRQGRDLLAEMAAELEPKIARKRAERDMLKAQFDQLGPDQGVIRINR